MGTYFFGQIVAASAIGNSFSLTHLCFDFLCFCFFKKDTSLFLGTTRCFKLLLYFLCPSHRISHLTKEIGSFYWMMVFRNQDLATNCAYCYWVPLLLNALRAQS